MKALFNRFNRGLSKDKAKEPKDSDLFSPSTSSYQKEKLPQLPPLREWPPSPFEQPQRSVGTPTSIASFKPLPELSSRPLPPIEDTPHPLTDYNPISVSHSRGPLSDVAEEDSVDTAVVTRIASPRADQDSAGRSSRKAANGSINTTNGHNDVQKKVAFLSPPPTPSSLGADRPLPDDASAPNKSTVVRSQPAHLKDPRGSTSTAASGSRTDVGSSKSSTQQTVKATSTRSATSPYPIKPGYGDGASIHQSLRSGTPFSQKSTGSVLPPASWSEGAEEDLVTHLGPRERTRQEVLWEIVASEERYVAELLKMKETFTVPLLHPYATSPIASPTMPEYDEMSRLETPLESLEHLPIASQEKEAPNMDSDSLNSDFEDDNDRMGKGFSESRRFNNKHNHPRSPYGTSRTGSGKNTSVPFPSRSHQSLPPPPRPNPNAASTHARGMLRKSRKSLTKADLIANGGVAPHQLPDDLRQCLEVIEDSILAGHLKLSEGLRKRYDEQYPLVRSLADVFVANSHILRGYADYVLHLERALEQANDAISTSNSTKRPKNKDADEWLKVCVFLRKLESDAQDRGETGLAISLSKPFQRLLKYPLLFQNLLFHTDPSTFEYESTLQMVAEVENIVRSIEDEKIQKEERDKTRDILARIEGLDKVKQLAAPKPSRVLVEERILTPRESSDVSKPSSPPPAGTTKGVRGKTSFKRLSDVLQTSGGGVGGKKDMWLVVFNDVVLRCQRTGTTSLPLGSAHASRANSLPELQGKSKYATTGRRNSVARPRNLYKFIKASSCVVSMEDVVRSRAQIHSAVQPRVVPMPDDDEDGGGDSDDSDRKSKMSFSYWGADKITLQKPMVKHRAIPGGLVTRRTGPTIPTGYSRESSANAKFGSRLVSASADSSASTARPSSRRTVTTPTGRRLAASDEGHSVKVTVTRPAWDGSTRTPVTSVQSTKRSRNTSQNSAATRTTITPSNKVLASPAPSEDSGVGLYRQMMANDPSLNNG
ncbi:Dbl-like domain-containing protein [Multifurca ochricompacta]|uniref:Dbl-like domain-containing protein n=1 Tax=Multifurca ochricompacta TaxID=376703 RepID=A0AAD4MAE9_9AGAM|nr:Dbl-like domain-containing protein [Multifurca ochricompacta]